MPVSAQETTASFNNNNLRFGNGTQPSVNATGTLNQPFYYSTDWFRLTYGNYALDFALAAGGDGSNQWNNEGTIVSDTALTDQVIDSSNFTFTTPPSGYGVIDTRGTLVLDGTTLEVHHRYELGETSRFIRATTEITNQSDTLATNIRVWVGTKDDWVGQTDGPTKTRGYISDNQFNTLASAADFSNAIQITSGDEGVLFYSTADSTATVQARYNGPYFSNVYNADPSTSQITATGDGSYGFYVRMPDLAAGESASFDWFYAAGEIASFPDIISEVAAAATVSKSIEEDTVATFSASDFQDAEGDAYQKIRISSLPDPAKGTLLLNDIPVSAGDEISSAEFTNLTYEPVANFNGSDTFFWQAWNVDSASFLSESRFNITINAVNDAPVFSATNTFLVDENSTSVATVSASDVDDDILTYSITGGADGSLFSLNTETGALSFATAPDFEDPSDNNTDNVYEVELTVTDNGSPMLSNAQTYQVTVNNVNESPELISDNYFIITEGGTAIGTAEARDTDGDTLTFSLVGGADADLFTIDSATGQLQFVNAPSYDSPLDSDSDNTYEITIQVTDGQGGITNQTIQVEIEQNAQPVTSTHNITIDEDTVATINVLETDYDIDGDTLSVISAAVDTGEVRVDGESIIWVPASNFNGVQAISYTISDGLANATGTINVTVTSVNDAPAAVDDIVVTFTDTPVAISALDNDVDVDGDELTISEATATDGVVTINADNTMTFMPDTDFIGRASVRYMVSDGELADSAEIEIIVNQDPSILVNVPPEAKKDDFVLTSWEPSSLDVLANDTDADGDLIHLLSASADVGEVELRDNQIMYTPLRGQMGYVEIQYSIIDSQGNIAKGSAGIEFDISDSANLPQISVPADLCGALEVEASALFTRVDLGVAEAEDRFGNPLPVSLINGSPLFPPGVNIAYWSTTDAEGNTAVAPQSVCVGPLISMGKDQTIVEEQSVEVAFYLNGVAPSYPVSIPYTVSGTASSADHDLVDGEVVIESGTSARIRFNTFADVTDEGRETVIITLDPSLNLGVKSSQTITISDDNVAPQVDLSVFQDKEQRMIVTPSGGNVSVLADVKDPNVGDTFTFNWQVKDASLFDIGTQSNEFVFDPASVSPGVYYISLTVTDSGSEAKPVTASIYIHVVEELPVLSNLDSDGDDIPDNIEGFADSDKDGIPDYLDRNAECNVLNEASASQSEYLIEGEPGVCLRRGALTLLGESGGALLSDTDISEARITLPVDTDAINIGGIFDFIAYGMPDENQSTYIVLPQRNPIPANAVYRKYSSQSGWGDFVEDADNTLWSTMGESGFCPPAGSSLWQPGLTENHWCVQLRIQDGGPNDDDGVTNGTVVDPGFVGVTNTSNTLPVVSPASLTLAYGTESEVIDALAYATDSDGDYLSLTSVTVNYGNVSIANNEIIFEPKAGYNGNADIRYGVSDGNGGTAFGIITVSFIANRTPVPGDIANITTKQGESTAAVNVFDAVTDADGDELTLESASALNGTVTTTPNGELVYTPNPDFSGEDTVTYVITDSFGNRTEGTFTVIVEPFQNVVAKTESSGGSMSLMWLLGLLVIALMRKNLMLIKRRDTFSVLLLCVFISALQAPDVEAAESTLAWYVGADIGRANTDVTSDDMDAAFNESGITASSLRLDDADTAWALYGGVAVNQYFSVELGYRDLGERALWLEGKTNYPDAYFEAAEQVYPESGDGLEARMIISYPITNVWKLSGRAGVFDWSRRFRTFSDESVRGRDSIDGTSFVYGAEVSYRFSSRLEGYAGVDRTQLDKHDVVSYLIGVRYIFHDE